MIKEIKARWAALGAFLLVLGAILIKAIPALFSQSGLGNIAGNYVAYVAALRHDLFYRRGNLSLRTRVGSIE